MYNLNRKLEELEVQGKSIKIAIIGAVFPIEHCADCTLP